MKFERSFLQASPSSSHKQPETGNKFHRAALEGYVDMLCEASRRETNLPEEENGLTPTLLAAAGGHLDALRILVGRGGDPERTTGEGANALHLATRRNHLNCVSFLVNFGVNMWALDNELHTAKDIAAIEQRKEILDFLDQMMAKQSALNTKQVQKLKAKAKIRAEKRLKQMRKAQLKAIKRVEKDERFLVRLSNNRKLLKAAHSISDIKLVGRPEVGQTRTNLNNNNKQPARLLGSASSASVSNLASSLHLSSDSDWPNSSNKTFKLKTRLPNSDDSVYSTSSVSSASGFNLTSGSSRASVVTSSSCKTSSSSSKLPKFSELTKIKTHEPGQLDPASKSSVKSSSSSSSTTSSSSSTSIGARLRGGVSRKVHLRRQINQSGDLNKPEAGDQQTKLCNVQPTIKLKLQSSQEASSAIKWPPAPTPSGDQKAEEAVELNSELEIKTERDESQQRLLTECLSQLKLRHQERLGQFPPADATSGQAKPKKAPSDELIRHRLSAADRFGEPLKPSQIRQQRQAILPERCQAREPKPVVEVKTPADSIGSAGSLVQRCQSASTTISVVELNSNSNSNSSSFSSRQPEEQVAVTGSDSSMEQFLRSHNLIDLLEVFERERIDLEALVLLSEEDLKSLNILLGPRRKLTKAIEEERRRQVVERPMYVMVDTPL